MHNSNFMCYIHYACRYFPKVHIVMNYTLERYTTILASGYTYCLLDAYSTTAVAFFVGFFNGGRYKN